MFIHSARKLEQNQIQYLSWIQLSTMIVLQSIGVSLFLFMPLWAHLVTLRGLRANQPFKQNNARYTLADGMILVAMMSLATTIGINIPIDRNTENWLLIISVNLLAILMWYKCIKLMNKNGIVKNGARISMQIFVYPSSIQSLALLLYCSVAFIASLVSNLNPNYTDPFDPHLFPLLLLLIVSYLWIYLTRMAFQAILNPHKPKSGDGT